MEMIMADLLAARSTIDGYRDVIVSVGAHDPTTRHILQQILVQEEEQPKALAPLLRVLSPHRNRLVQALQRYPRHRVDLRRTTHQMTGRVTSLPGIS